MLSVCARVVQLGILRAYSLGCVVLHAWRQCRRHLGRWCCGPASLSPAEQVARLRQRVGAFDKVPTHVAVVLDCSEELGENAPSSLGQGQGGWILDRLGAMTCWCASAGVAALTVYDADGAIAASVDDLSIAVEQQKARFSLSHLQAYVQRPSPPPASTSGVRRRATASARRESDSAAGEPGGAGDEGGPVIHVTLLSASDGMEELAAVSRRLAKDAAVASTRNSTPADQALIEANLSGFSGEVEGPELLLRFGGGPLASALSTDAFPPWHLRLTEIHHQERLASYGCQDFLMSLQRYAKTEQRVGV